MDASGPFDRDTYCWARSFATGLLYRRHWRYHTRSATVLVHEAWAALTKKFGPGVFSRESLGLVASEMQQILDQYARDIGAQKRGGGSKPASLSGDEPAQKFGKSMSPEQLTLREALLKLASLHVRQAFVFLMRETGRMTNEEVAVCLDVCAATVKKDHAIAQAFLRRELSKGNDQ